MKTASWLLLVAIALASGFLAGREMGPLEGEEQVEDTRGKRLGPVESSKGEAKRKTSGSRTRMTSAEKQRQRVETLQQMMDEFLLYGNGLGSSIDPFGGHRININDGSRLFARIYEAREEDFPDLFELCLKETESGTMELDYEKVDFAEAMIRRWCDFDPRAVFGWLQENRELFDTESFQSMKTLVAVEAVDTDTVWAVGLVEELWEAAETNAELDPFAADTSGDGEGIFPVTPASIEGMDGIFYLLTRNDAELAFERLLSSSRQNRLEGVEGWIEAMFVLGREAEVPDLMTKFPAGDLESIQEVYGEILLRRDRAAGKNWLNSKEGETSAEMDRRFLYELERGSEEWMDAVGWYMSRAQSEEERVARMYSLVRYSLGSGEESERILEDLAERGIDVQAGHTVLFWSALERGHHDYAFERIETVPAEQRGEAIDRLIRSSVDTKWVPLGGKNYAIYEADRHDLERADAAGYGERYRSFVQQANEAAAAGILEWLEAQKAE